jgi:protein involved in polysaccharide export with SLBB domain
MHAPVALAVRRFPAVLVPLALAGCIGQRVVYPIMPSGPELEEFEQAGPLEIKLDRAELAALDLGNGDYLTVAGDLLEIQLPVQASGGAVLGTETVSTIKSRISKEGKISLPQVGEVVVAGKSSDEIESLIADAYVQQGVLSLRPNVVVSVTGFRQVNVAVIGAVDNPGIVQLRSDRLTLLGALMAAGGILDDPGAQGITIVKPGQDGKGVPVDLPVSGTNIPFEDVKLAGGETIVVEPLVQKEFTTIGLVKKPGPVPYPEGKSYNLMQALALSGGTDDTAAPRFATIYRIKSNGQVIGCTFRIDGTALVNASNVHVKPGDVIAVEHTQGSWMRSFLSQVLGFRASFSATSAASL